LLQKLNYAFRSLIWDTSGQKLAVLSDDFSALLASMDGFFLDGKKIRAELAAAPGNIAFSMEGDSPLDYFTNFLRVNHLGKTYSIGTCPRWLPRHIDDVMSCLGYAKENH